MIKTIHSHNGIQKYKFLALIYLISVASSSLANAIGGNVQNFYRVPVLSIRWIDISILIVLFSALYSLQSKYVKISKVGILVPLCLLYLIFETFQLFKSWGLNDAPSQVSHFLCTLSLVIVIDLYTYALSVQQIACFLKSFLFFGAVVTIVSNAYLLFSFVSGNVVYEDLDIRVALDVLGSKETVYPFVLTPFVYAFGLYFLQKGIKLWQKILLIAAILSIYGALVITFHRGTLVTVLAITVYFLFSSGKAKSILLNMGGLLIMLFIAYALLGKTLAEKGYDPIDKIGETLKFTTDVNNPEWDKGRSLSRSYAIAGWKKNLWTGAGYDELFHYGLPEGIATGHNGFVTSLFHRGILGTILLTSILTILFRNAAGLWKYLKRKNDHHSSLMRLLILVSFFWIITFMSQEALWEKYSLSIEFMYLGIISNYYIQRTV